MKKNQNGFGVVELLIIVAALAVLGFVGFKVIPKLGDDNKNDDSKSATSTTEASEEGFIWQQTANGWEAQSEAPDCPAQPMLKAPADLSKVTSVLYPGQIRGTTSYKPHGGLRFDNSTDNKITVTTPMDGYIINGVRNIADGGTEVQYTFSIMNNCGISTVIGHLRELTPEFQKIADTFPEPTMNSATQNVNPPVYVKQGEVLATKIGILGDHNTFFDWGVFDYRQTNEASKSVTYQTAHSTTKDTTWYAVCWLQEGWLPSKDQTTLAALPSGDKTSDYCK